MSTTPTANPRHAWIFNRAVSLGELNGEEGELPESFRPAARHLAGLPDEERGGACRHVLAALGPLGDSLHRAMLAQTPSDPPPEPEKSGIRCATLADLERVEASDRFVWQYWIARRHFTLLSSEVKTGKTRVAMAMARRNWLGERWPDGQAPTFPEGTPSLWICGDRHQDELKGLAHDFGLPPEAVLLNANPESPYSGWDLDDPANIDGLRQRIEKFRPGLVLIDTVWKTTRRKLSVEVDVNAFIDPIVSIAQETDTAIVGMMHLSKDGETLGRRLEGVARAVIKMEKPDPDGQPNRRKLWVDRANSKPVAPLGVTIRDGGCDFDHQPPSTAETASRRRPGPVPERQAECAEWLASRLGAGQQPLAALRAAATEDADGPKFSVKTLYAAHDSLGVVESQVGNRKYWALPLRECPI